MSDFGKSIPIDEITLKKLVKPNTLAHYKRVVEKFNIHFKVPDITRLYYEYFGTPEMKQKLIDAVPDIFTVNSPTSYSAKIAAFKAFMISVPELPSEIGVVWNTRYKVPEVENKPNIPELVMDWPELQEKLLRFANDTNQDSRFRVICHIYACGLVVRTSVLIKTTLVDDGVMNYLNLETGEWKIRQTKTGFKNTLTLPEETRNAIQDIVKDRQFMFHTCLVPRMNGEPYVGMSMANFPPWKRSGLPGCNVCRQTFETHNWNSGLDLDEAAERSRMLDHNPVTVANHYIKKINKPKPVIKLRKTPEGKVVETKPKYTCCLCNKSYMYRSGLYRHNKSVEHQANAQNSNGVYYWG